MFVHKGKNPLRDLHSANAPDGTNTRIPNHSSLLLTIVSYVRATVGDKAATARGARQQAGLPSTTR